MNASRGMRSSRWSSSSTQLGCVADEREAPGTVYALGTRWWSSSHARCAGTLRATSASEDPVNLAARQDGTTKHQEPTVSDVSHSQPPKGCGVNGAAVALSRSRVDGRWREGRVRVGRGRSPLDVWCHDLMSQVWGIPERSWCRVPARIDDDRVARIGSLGRETGAVLRW